MVMYANEVENKERLKLPEIKKNNYNIYVKWQSYGSILVMIFV